MKPPALKKWWTLLYLHVSNMIPVILGKEGYGIFYYCRLDLHRLFITMICFACVATEHQEVIIPTFTTNQRTLSFLWYPIIIFPTVHLSWIVLWGSTFVAYCSSTSTAHNYPDMCNTSFFGRQSAITVLCTYVVHGWGISSHSSIDNAPFALVHHFRRVNALW